MSSNSPFKLEPVKRYRNAVYASESGESIIGRACWLAWTFPRKIVKGAVTLLLAAGLALGTGCMENDAAVSYQPDQGDEDTELEESIEADDDYWYPETAGVEYECSSGDFYCIENRSVAICEGGTYLQYECDAFCESAYGEGYVSDGCNAQDPDDFCSCVEKNCIEDGPVACDEDGQLVTCEEGELKTVSCWNECPPYPEEDYSLALVDAYCDDDAEGLCVCEYDTFDGGMYECYPEDKQCKDSNTLLVCNDDFYYEEISCEDYCAQEFGPEYFSWGCDIEAEDPCQCEYGMTPGIIASCTPGEVYCPSLQHVAICEAGMDAHMIFTCEEYCVRYFGEDAYPTEACDETNSSNVCSCETGMIDGDMARVLPSDLKK